MQRLGAQDALFVYGETADWPLSMGAVIIYEGTAGGEPLDLARVRELYRQRLPLVPAFRQRLVRAPGGLDRPVWVEDEQVDVAAHIHRVQLPAPGDDHRLAALVGELHTRPLDPSRPLWEIWVIEGLEGGRVAVFTRLHHAATDGVRGAQIQAAFADADPAAPLARPGSVEGAGTDIAPLARRLGDAGRHLAAAPVRAARAAAEASRLAGGVVGAARRHRADAATLPAPRTRFNRPVTRRRAFAFCSLPRAPVKALARREQVTVNDVVLSLVGGALRRHLSERGELPDRSLVAAVPIGLTDPTAPPDVGNQLSVMLASLATDVADPIDRLHRIARSTRAGKALQQAVGARMLTDALDIAPPAAYTVFARAYHRLRVASLLPPAANVTVSNVRGPATQLYLAGAKMLALYPVGPVADGLGLNVTVHSYLNALDVGIFVCPDLDDQPWQLIDALRAETAALPPAADTA